MQKYFYVYYSFEEFGRGYIGSRVCKCIPEKDIKYFGSYRDKLFKPTQKIIIETFFSKEEMLNAEILLHNFYEVNINPHFSNKAKQTSNKFSTIGLKPSEEIIDKLREHWKGEKNPNYGGGKNNSFYGRKHTEEWKKNQSIRFKGRKNSEESKIKQSRTMRGRKPWNKGITDPSITGGKNPRAKRILYNNQVFECIKDAVEITNITRHMILKTCVFLN